MPVGKRTRTPRQTGQTVDPLTDESASAGNLTVTRSWDANVKRMYDEYQHESLESIRRNRSYIDKILSDAQASDNQRQQHANLALQNAVETANMVSKQALAHGRFGLDRLWAGSDTAQGGVDIGTLRSVLGQQPTIDAIAAVVLEKLRETKD